MKELVKNHGGENVEVQEPPHIRVWLERFRHLDGTLPQELRALRELANEIYLYVGDGYTKDLEPFSRREQWAIRMFSILDTPHGTEDVDYADLFFDPKQNQIVTSVEGMLFSIGRAKEFDQEFARAMRRMFASRAWVRWEGARGEEPRIASLHVPLELPDEKEGEVLLHALSSAFASQNSMEMKRALFAIADALNKRLPISASIVPSYAKANESYCQEGDFASDLWVIPFASGTGGQRLLFEPDSKILSWPSQGIGLSWTFQDGFQRLFGDRARFDHETSEYRKIFVQQ